MKPKALKTLKDHDDQIMLSRRQGVQLKNNGIKCPSCPLELYDVDTSIVIDQLTNPRSSRTATSCKCGYKGFRLV